MLIHRLTGRKLARIAAILLFAGLVVGDLLVAQVVFQPPPPVVVPSVVPFRQYLPLVARSEPPAVDVIVPTTQSQAVTPAATAQKTYTVKSGDTLYGIATSNGITVSDLAAANQLNIEDFIMPGQELVIPAAAAPKP